MSLIAAVLLAAAAHRNPFQYVEAPKKEPVERRALSPPAVVASPPEEIRRAESPPLHRDEGPAFEYQLIGRFGRAEDPIAAFVGKGQVITVQNGDVIDDVFVVKRIGIESVEIGYVSRPETLTIRLQ